MATPPGSPPRSPTHTPPHVEGFTCPQLRRKDAALKDYSAILHEWTEQAGVQEKAARKECSKIIIQFIRAPSRELDLSEFQLTSLPEVFDHYVFRRNLQHLDLQTNRIVELPVTFTALQSLETLNLNDNLELRALPHQLGELTHLRELSLEQEVEEDELLMIEFPESLGDLYNLRTLKLSGYQLDQAPVPLVGLEHLQSLTINNCGLITIDNLCLGCTGLEFLDVSSNKINEIPDSIRHLSRIAQMNLSDNPFEQIDAAIFDLPPDATVTIERSMLSEDQMDIVTDTTLEEGYEGPTFILGSRKEFKERAVELLEDIREGLHIEGDFEAPSIMTTEEIASSIYCWLKRLTSTVSVSKPEYSSVFRAALDLIDFACENEKFGDVFLNKLPEAIATCGDRVILSILHLEIEKMLAEIDKEDIPSQVECFKKGHYVMSLLEKEAHKKLEQLWKDQAEGVDDVEVLLAYPMKLKEALGLPFSVDRMFFFKVSKVTEEDLAGALDHIERELQTHHGFIEYLMKESFWKDFLIEHFKDDVEELNRRVAEAEYEECDQIYQKGIRELTLRVVLDHHSGLLKREAEEASAAQPAAKRARLDE